MVVLMFFNPNPLEEEFDTSLSEVNYEITNADGSPLSANSVWTVEKGLDWLTSEKIEENFPKLIKSAAKQRDNYFQFVDRYLQEQIGCYIDLEDIQKKREALVKVGFLLNPVFFKEGVELEPSKDILNSFSWFLNKWRQNFLNDKKLFQHIDTASIALPWHGLLKYIFNLKLSSFDHLSETERMQYRNILVDLKMAAFRLLGNFYTMLILRYCQAIPEAQRSQLHENLVELYGQFPTQLNFLAECFFSPPIKCYLNVTFQGARLQDERESLSSAPSDRGSYESRCDQYIESRLLKKVDEYDIEFFIGSPSEAEQELATVLIHQVFKVNRFHKEEIRSQLESMVDFKEPDIQPIRPPF